MHVTTARSGRSLRHGTRAGRAAPRVGFAAAMCVALLALGAAAIPAVAGAAPPVSVEFMPGYAAPETPEALDKVGVIKVGQPTARNVLVLEPGTSAAGAYFVPFAKWVAEALPEWQVWAVVRRESLLEDQSELNLAKEGKATAEEVFNYYIGWISNPKIEHHLVLNQNGDPYAKKWGMKVAVEDLHRVIEAAHKQGGAVVLGGHSLGGSVVTAYATWDFGGTPGADGLSGLVYDDGGSSPIPVSEEKAKEELKKLEEAPTPWLSFGGISAPFAGLFGVLGGAATQLEPNGTSLAFSSPLVPSDLKPPKPPCSSATNEAEFAFGVDVGTSPESLIAAQAHVGKLVTPSEGEGLCTWSSESALTPIHRYAEMFYGQGLIGQDGAEWYFPQRLTIDTGAVAEGNENPAQKVLELEATEGHNLPKDLKILAIDSELDKKLIGPRASLIAAEVLAEQSGIPKENLTLINAEETYAHNDPAGAYPKNVFFEALVPYLKALSVQRTELKSWVVSGSLTDKRQGQAITLPEGSAFNGLAELSTQTGAGSVEGDFSFPPFSSTLRIFGLLPTSFGLTLAQVGPAKGTIGEAEAGRETLTLPVKLNLGITSLKILGLTIPTQCATAEPIALDLVTTRTREELLFKGWSFTGTTTLPKIRCEGGFLGSLFGFVLSSLLSGPENPYAIAVTAPGG
jgi:pimeloyl-ACP methyl ester carboxylesterase